MQPYLLPYIGYWELFAAADVFVVLDDVQFIRRGWVNRNRIRNDRSGRSWSYLTVPVAKARRETAICDMRMRFSPGWGQALSHRLVHLFGRDALKCELAHNLIALPTRPDQALLPALLEQLLATSRMLQLETRVVLSSALDPHPKASGQQRLIDLVLALGGNQYLNLSGGQGLYEPDSFADAGIELRILPLTDFRPWARCMEQLSVLDGILAGAAHEIRGHLAEFRI